MSRGHTQGFDSNAAQFARLGNPWEGDGMLRQRARKARRKAGIRPCRQPALPVDRSASEAFADIRAIGRIKADLKARAGTSRVVAPNEEKAPHVAFLTGRSEAKPLPIGYWLRRLDQRAAEAKRLLVVREADAAERWLAEIRKLRARLEELEAM